MFTGLGAALNVLIVGASIGGLTVAEVLRRRGFDGAITLVGEERHPPYDRPPLSKQVLTGSWPAERTRLLGSDALDGLGVEWVLGRRAVHLDRGGRVVALDDGRRLPYDRLVIATGLTPRLLPGQPVLDGLRTLRTIDDALALRGELKDAARVAVVGAGVLGCEVAAGARTLGLEVTLVDPAPAPMARHLGARLGALVARTHRGHGVDVRVSSEVHAFTGTAGRVDGLELTGGEKIRADLVIVTIGAIPATGWLIGSGLDLSDGVTCDAYGQAAPGVYAVGDVARFPTGRVESRTNATEQAVAVAGNILGDERPFSSIPYFWTDQYDVKLQIHGRIGHDDRIRWIEGEPGAGRWVALAENGDEVTAAIGWKHARGVRLAREQISALSR
ncbi:NAD(P)/FAD-dependent oxidoreductase [Nonomuraea endophytica]|uniref:NADPH-dependent 2,4-dienoyl-CoA reductase/sulfur reductase-like enzyme n=1 Tax=Nonomuraea endophytica TaxID=714136 RepID=A0A7W8A7D0_9ACTN|nr:FAD-dependent oxidoreductase [Nonomuraea endophytica]MBB5080925.1 NADPH-dependent 2,4-dienoyl-CoA reductase/sulfur reductase-like enzyme [Nonomuraea endophytica]